MKIAPRAEITKEFVNGLKEIYADRLKAQKEEMNKQGEFFKKAYFERNKIAINKLVKLLNDPDVFDYEMTRLRSLRYSSFSIRTSKKGRIYVCGLTEDVKFVWHDAHEKKSYGMYNFGPYNVCVGRKMFAGEDRYAPFQFYPELNPATYRRHPHHTGSSDNGDPLDASSSTCLGGFNEIVYQAIKEADIVETFRSLSLYLNTYNQSSPLGRSYLSEYSWAVGAVPA